MRHHANRLTSITPRIPVPTASGTPNGTSSSNGSSVVVVASITCGGISSSTSAVVAEVDGWEVESDVVSVRVVVIGDDEPTVAVVVVVVSWTEPVVVGVIEVAAALVVVVMVVVGLGFAVVVVEDCGNVDGDVVMVDGRLPVVEVSTVVVGQC